VEELLNVVQAEFEAAQQILERRLRESVDVSQCADGNYSGSFRRLFRYRSLLERQIGAVADQNTPVESFNCWYINFGNCIAGVAFDNPLDVGAGLVK
jgi:hypothetical protein